MLEARDLECERGGKKLFRPLAFALAPGQTLRVAGANGSGKTSLLRMLCGLLPPSAGEVRWQGEPIRALGEDYARALVYLGHAPAVKDELTAGENLAIACRLAGTPASREQVATMLSILDVPDSPVGKLSQGQKRRAALARLSFSFVETKPLWLLDEPFTALDARGIEVVKALMSGHAKRGAIVVYTTHQDPGIEGARVLELG